MCEGRHPARVVLDPSARMPANARLLRQDGSRCIVVTSETSAPDLPAHVEIVRLRMGRLGLDPNAVVTELARLGLFRVLVEGGAQTISRFIQARALDRLHILVSPIILGSGQTGLDLPAIEMVDEAIRPVTKAHLIGNEVVFDCNFRTVKDQTLEDGIATGISLQQRA